MYLSCTVSWYPRNQSSVSTLASRDISRGRRSLPRLLCQRVDRWAHRCPRGLRGSNSSTRSHRCDCLFPKSCTSNHACGACRSMSAARQSRLSYKTYRCIVHIDPNPAPTSKTSYSGIDIAARNVSELTVICLQVERPARRVQLRWLLCRLLAIRKQSGQSHNLPAAPISQIPRKCRKSCLEPDRR